MPINQDQAEKLRKDMETDQDIESIMASHLPPRREYHKRQQKKNKTSTKKKRKIKYPLVTILAILFILLPIIILYVYDDLLPMNQLPKNSQNDLFEQVEFDRNGK